MFLYSLVMHRVICLKNEVNDYCRYRLPLTKTMVRR